MNDSAIDIAKHKLTSVLEEALDNNLITKEEFKHMDPDAKSVAKFYMTFKVHKEHEHGKAPPGRPICSGCGSMYENVSKYVEHFIKEAGTSHPTYLQDTPDFLRYIEGINMQGQLPENALLLTMDVVGLFTNIPEKDGTDAVREALEEETRNEVNTEFIVRLLQLILQNNIMEFNSEFYKQEIGAPMGSRPVPPYANIFYGQENRS